MLYKVLKCSRLFPNILELCSVFYVVFAWCAHIVYNSISGLTPFTYFRFIVGIEVTVGESSHILEVKRWSSFLGEKCLLFVCVRLLLSRIKYLNKIRSWRVGILTVHASSLCACTHISNVFQTHVTVFV